MWKTGEKCDQAENIREVAPGHQHNSARADGGPTEEQLHRWVWGLIEYQNKDFNLHFETYHLKVEMFVLLIKVISS